MHNTVRDAISRLAGDALWSPVKEPTPFAGSLRRPDVLYASMEHVGSLALLFFFILIFCWWFVRRAVGQLSSPAESAMALTLFDANEHALTVLQRALESGQTLAPTQVCEILTVLAHNAQNLAFTSDVDAALNDTAARLYDAAVHTANEQIRTTAGELVLMANQREQQLGRQVEERLSQLAAFVEQHSAHSTTVFAQMAARNAGQLQELFAARLAQAAAEAEALDKQRALDVQMAFAKSDAANKKALAEATAGMLTHADRAAAARSEAAMAHMRADLVSARATTEARINEATSLAEASAIGRATAATTAVAELTANLNQQVLGRVRAAEAQVAAKIPPNLVQQLGALRARADELEDRVAGLPDNADYATLAADVGTAEVLARGARDLSQRAAADNDRAATRFEQEARRLDDSIAKLRASMERFRAASPSIDVASHVRAAAQAATAEMARQLDALFRRVNAIEDTVWTRPAPPDTGDLSGILKRIQALEAAPQAPHATAQPTSNAIDSAPPPWAQKLLADSAAAAARIARLEVAAGANTTPAQDARTPQPEPPSWAQRLLADSAAAAARLARLEAAAGAITTPARATATPARPRRESANAAADEDATPQQRVQQRSKTSTKRRPAREADSGSSDNETSEASTDDEDSDDDDDVSPRKTAKQPSFLERLHRVQDLPFQDDGNFAFLQRLEAEIGKLKVGSKDPAFIKHRDRIVNEFADFLATATLVGKQGRTQELLQKGAEIAWRLRATIAHHTGVADYQSMMKRFDTCDMAYPSQKFFAASLAKCPKPTSQTKAQAASAKRRPGKDDKPGKDWKAKGDKGRKKEDKGKSTKTPKNGSETE